MMYAFGLVLMSLLLISSVSANPYFMRKSEETISLVEKDPSDWSIIEEPESCGHFDFTNDSKVNFRDLLYVLRNRLDVNNDGRFDRNDISYMRDHYDSCEAAKATLEFSAISSHGRVRGQTVKTKAFNLEPKESYQLIYYGDAEEGINDVYPHATCVGREKRSSTHGYLRTNARFDWMSFKNDGVDQKFWLVKADDVDCRNKEMTAWNPEQYLFETSFL